MASYYRNFTLFRLWTDIMMIPLLIERLSVECISRLLWFCTTMLCDWSKESSRYFFNSITSELAKTDSSPARTRFPALDPGSSSDWFIGSSLTRVITFGFGLTTIVCALTQF